MNLDVPHLKKDFAFGVEDEYATHAVIRNQDVPIALVHGHVYGLLECIVREVFHGFSVRRHLGDIFTPPVHHDQTVVGYGDTYQQNDGE